MLYADGEWKGWWIKDRSKERENYRELPGLMRVAPDCCCVKLMNVQSSMEAVPTFQRRTH